MYFGWSRSDAISDGQSAAPIVRSRRPGNGCQQRLRVTVGNRQHGNLRDRLCFRQRQPLRVLRGTDSRREWVAGILSVHHAAALNTFFGAIRTGGKLLALEVTVVSRIGVNDATHGSMFGRDFGLDASPATPVARNHDCALYRNAQPLELLVVVTHTVVYVNQRAGDVSIGRIGVVGG